jgi:hypothetical protein
MALNLLRSSLLFLKPAYSRIFPYCLQFSNFLLFFYLTWLITINFSDWLILLFFCSHWNWMTWILDFRSNLFLCLSLIGPCTSSHLSYFSFLHSKLIIHIPIFFFWREIMSSMCVGPSAPASFSSLHPWANLRLVFYDFMNLWILNILHYIFKKISGIFI